MNRASAPSDSPPTDEPSRTDAPTTDAAPADAPTADAAPAGPASADAIDLDAIHRDLDGVEAALTRLDDGTYWSDESTGAPLSDELLSADPTARRSGD